MGIVSLVITSRRYNYFPSLLGGPCCLFALRFSTGCLQATSGGQQILAGCSGFPCCDYRKYGLACRKVLRTGLVEQK